jgi:hypothetical protein
MEINIAYQEFRLSGGAANSDQNAALGGAMSSERVLSQSTTALSNITGVSIEYAAGNPTGAGTLHYVAAGPTLAWQPFNAVVGAAVNVSEGGKYSLFGSTGYLAVSVEPSGTPVGDETDAVTVDNIANETFDDVTKAESFSGDNEYRAFYVTNEHDTDPMLDVVAFISTQPTPGLLAIAKDPAGVGDGISRAVTSITRTSNTATVTTGATNPFITGQSVRISGANEAAYNGVVMITVTGTTTFTYSVAGAPATPATGTIVTGRGLAAVVSNESTAPSGITFTIPTAESPDGISFGQIDPGEVAAFWIKRTIPTRNIVPNAASLSMLQFQTYF